jgi:hypothetical protein
MQAAQHIKTENALRSISRAFPMTAISELRIRRESDGSGFEIEMMQGPSGYTTRFQLDRVPGDVGTALVEALKYAVFQQQQQTSEKLDQMGVEG